MGGGHYITPCHDVASRESCLVTTNHRFEPKSKQTGPLFNSSINKIFHLCYHDTKSFTNPNTKATYTTMEMQGTPIGSTNQGMKVRDRAHLISSRPLKHSHLSLSLFWLLVLTYSTRTLQTPNAIRTPRAKAPVLLPPTRSPQNQPAQAANSAKTVTLTLSQSRGTNPP